MDSGNPYKSPSVRGEYLKPRRRSVWEGPLLSLSVASFIFATITRILTVVPEGRSIQDAVFASLTGIGALFLALSFQLHRGARRRL